MNGIAETLKDPHWFPYEFDAGFDNISFVETNADALRAAPFLDQRFLKSNESWRKFSVDDIANTLKDDDPPHLPMIFHSAFCCSTLLAKALDQPKTCLALKEPHILMSLANAKRMLRKQNRSESQFTIRFNIVMKLLDRRFNPQEQILVKPSNSVNNLLEDVLAADFPIALIYASLEDFLISVLKKGEACKSFMRTQYNIFTLDKCVIADIPPRQAMTFTDLQVTTLVWRHQVELFHKVKRANPDTVNVRDKGFLANKFGTLAAICDGLDLEFSKKEIKKLSEGPIFAQNAKFSELEMDGVQREREAMRIKERYVDELSFTLNWAKTIRFEGDTIE